MNTTSLSNRLLTLASAFLLVCGLTVATVPDTVTADTAPIPTCEICDGEANCVSVAGTSITGNTDCEETSYGCSYDGNACNLDGDDGDDEDDGGEGGGGS